MTLSGNGVIERDMFRNWKREVYEIEYTDQESIQRQTSESLTQIAFSTRACSQNVLDSVRETDFVKDSL